MTIIKTVALAMAISVVSVTMANRFVPAPPSAEVEKISVQIADAATSSDEFDEHWRRAAGVVLLMSAMSQDLMQPKTQVVHTEKIVPDAAAPKLEIETPKVRRKPKTELNICQRHNLRKVYINGGRSWRCRK
jgi:hypothetical protein